MSQTALAPTRTVVWRWFAIQIAVVIVFAVIFLFYQGTDFAGSVLLGGAISILPNMLFARWWFSYFKAKAANRLVGKFYIGTVAKLMLTVALFIVAFKFMYLKPIACLLGYIIAQLAFWVTPILEAFDI